MFSKIALGTVQFGMHYGISNTTGQTTINEAEKILEYANQIGINTLDTAYGYGESEVVLGKFHADRFKLVTKFLPESSEGKIQTQLDCSLSRLKVNHVYGFLAHRPKDLLENTTAWNILEKLKAKNKVKKIGFSLNEPREYFLLKEKGFVPDLVQLPYNYLDHRFTEVIEDLKSNNCEVHSRSVFLQGLFFMKTDELSVYFSGVIPVIKNLQNQFKSKLSAVLLKHVLSNDLIDKVVIGVQNLNQLKDSLVNLEAATQLTPFEGKVEDAILQPSKWPA